MTTIEDLDKWHGRLAHEFNRIAHNEYNWCLTNCGFEKVFKKREGAKKVLGSFFTPETLFTRSWPDYYLRGDSRFWLVEVKGPAYVSPLFGGSRRVRVEAYQALLLHHLYLLTGMETIYVFMNPDKSGWVCPVQRLPIEEMCETETFRTKWPRDLREKTRQMFHSLHPNLPIQHVSDPEKGKGSSDPFLAFDYNDLLSVAKSVRSWFDSQGRQNLTNQDHIAWEGKDHLQWRSFLP
jgi:hypothetical protein